MLYDYDYFHRTKLLSVSGRQTNLPHRVEQRSNKSCTVVGVIGTRMLGEVACGFSSPHFHYIHVLRLYLPYVSIVQSNVDQLYLLPVRLCY